MLTVILPIVGLAVVLLILAFFTKRFRRDNHADPAQVGAHGITETNSSSSIENADEIPDAEFVAILTAAVMSAMGPKMECKIRIKSFRRVPQTSPVWNTVGRSEFISNKL